MYNYDWCPFCQEDAAYYLGRFPFFDVKITDPEKAAANITHDDREGVVEAYPEVFYCCACSHLYEIEVNVPTGTRILTIHELLSDPDFQIYRFWPRR